MALLGPLLVSLTTSLAIGALLGLSTLHTAEGYTSGLLGTTELQAPQFEAAKRYTSDTLLRTRRFENRQLYASNPASYRVDNITFKNPLASQFYVNGTSIPFVDWDVGPSWAGLLPISNNPNETRKLFFWFFPPEQGGSLDDLIFWTNGGPGCSSLEGFLQENGPISWGYGQAKPTPNLYSWTNLSSMLWVEQPVGTGYSQGTPDAKDEEDVAAQLVGFLQQFLNVFLELKGKRFYISGESYAGTYIPYIADYIYRNPSSLDLDLQGIWMADPLISWPVVQEQIPAVDFVHKYEHVFALNQTFLKHIDQVAEKCDYAGYIDKYVKYPPQGLLPMPGNDTVSDPGCDVWDEILNATLIINPAFNVYRIFDMYPILWDVLQSPEAPAQAQTPPAYFDREDVKKAIHAPLDTTWAECADIDVFPKGDASLPPVFTVFPSVIEKSNKSIIMHGLGDYVLIADGARIAIQNMTWGGKQGFQHSIPIDSFIVDGIGALGNVHEERGLTYYEIVLSGHMVPQFSPWSAFQSVEYLLGVRRTP